MPAAALGTHVLQKKLCRILLLVIILETQKGKLPIAPFYRAVIKGGGGLYWYVPP